MILNKKTKTFQLREINQFPWGFNKMLKFKRRRYLRVKYNEVLIKSKRFSILNKKFLKTYKLKTKLLFKKYFAPKMSERQFKKLFRSNSRYKATFFNIIKTEHRLDTIIFRLFLFPSILQARYFIENNFFIVNNLINNSPKFILNPNDIIQPSNKYAFNMLYNNILQVISSLHKYFNRIFFKYSYPFIYKKISTRFKEGSPKLRKPFRKIVKRIVKNVNWNRTQRYKLRYKKHNFLTTYLGYFLTNNRQKYLRSIRAFKNMSNLKRRPKNKKIALKNKYMKKLNTDYKLPLFNYKYISLPKLKNTTIFVKKKRLINRLYAKKHFQHQAYYNFKITATVKKVINDEFREYKKKKLINRLKHRSKKKILRDRKKGIKINKKKPKLKKKKSRKVKLYYYSVTKALKTKVLYFSDLNFKPKNTKINYKKKSLKRKKKNNNNFSPKTQKKFLAYKFINTYTTKRRKKRLNFVEKHHIPTILKIIIKKTRKVKRKVEVNNDKKNFIKLYNELEKQYPQLKIKLKPYYIPKKGFKKKSFKRYLKMRLSFRYKKKKFAKKKFMKNLKKPYYKLKLNKSLNKQLGLLTTKLKKILTKNKRLAKRLKYRYNNMYKKLKKANIIKKILKGFKTKSKYRYFDKKRKKFKRVKINTFFKFNKLNFKPFFFKPSIPIFEREKRIPYLKKKRYKKRFLKTYLIAKKKEKNFSLKAYNSLINKKNPYKFFLDNSLKKKKLFLKLKYPKKLKFNKFLKIKSQIKTRSKFYWASVRIKKKKYIFFKYTKKFNNAYKIFKNFKLLNHSRVNSFKDTNMYQTTPLIFLKKIKRLNFKLSTKNKVKSFIKPNFLKIFFKKFKKALKKKRRKALKAKKIIILKRYKRKYLKLKGSFLKFNNFKIKLEYSLKEEKNLPIQIKYKKIDLLIKHRPLLYYFIEMDYNSLVFTLLKDIDLFKFPYKTCLDFKTISRLYQN